MGSELSGASRKEQEKETGEKRGASQISYKIAVSVGHYAGEQNKEIEYPANDKTATLLHNLLIVNAIPSEIFRGKLVDKVQAINEYNPDIAIECHFNQLEWPHNPVKYGDGFEVCVMKGSVKGKLLGAQIIEGFGERLPFRRRGTGVWERTELYFLKHTRAPAAIIEPLFLDNPIEREFLKMERGYEFIATSVFIGIQKYFAASNS